MWRKKTKVDNINKTWQKLRKFLPPALNASFPPRCLLSHKLLLLPRLPHSQSVTLSHLSYKLSPVFICFDFCLFLSASIFTCFEFYLFCEQFSLLLLVPSPQLATLTFLTHQHFGNNTDLLQICINLRKFAIIFLLDLTNHYIRVINKQLQTNCVRKKYKKIPENTTLIGNGIFRWFLIELNIFWE